MISQEVIQNLLLGYAYSPLKVYFFVVAFMCMSSFGLPIPEELILVTVGFVAYMALNPDIHPPPHDGAVGVDYITLSIVCFFAVLLSDFLIYLIGKFLGPKLRKNRFFKKMLSDDKMKVVDKWYGKYGAWVCGIFRFLPGIRFPGHMSCGMMGVNPWKFLAVDGLAALISVPTQVILVALYGKIILAQFKKFKIAIAIIVVCFLVFYFLKKYFNRQKAVS